MLNLDLELLDENTRHRKRLEVALNELKHAELKLAVSKGKLSKSKPAESQAPDKPSTKIPEAAFQAAKKLVLDKVGKKNESAPCLSHFILGSCPRGAGCKLHHQGKAGSFRPPGY